MGTWSRTAMKLRQLFENVYEEAPDSFDGSLKTIGICYGRWNPPHKGHREVWKAASKNPIWFVGTNQNTEGPKDPLPYAVKLQVMEAVWPGVAGHVIPEQDLFVMASRIYQEYGANVHLKVYTDEDWLYQGLAKYNGHMNQKHGGYKFAQIDHVRTERLARATDLRAAVHAGNREAFYKDAGIPHSATITVGDREMPVFDVVAHYLNKYPVKKPAVAETTVIDPELKTTMDYAQKHYPGYDDPQLAFNKFTQRSLAHAKHDDVEQNEKIAALAAKIARVEKALQAQRGETEGQEDTSGYLKYFKVPEPRKPAEEKRFHGWDEYEQNVKAKTPTPVPVKEANRQIRAMLAELSTKPAGKERKAHHQAHRGGYIMRDVGGYDRTYHLNRIGMAMAMADGKSTGPVEMDASSWYEKYNTFFPYSEEEHNKIKSAMKTVPTDGAELPGGHKSEELPDVNVKSPVAKPKRNKYGI